MKTVRIVIDLPAEEAHRILLNLAEHAHGEEEWCRLWGFAQRAAAWGVLALSLDTLAAAARSARE